MEEWKNIEGYEWKYQISNLGKVKSINYLRTWKEKILSLHKCKNWYSRAWLFNNSIGNWYLVSRLVAQYFIPNPLGLPFVLHKDETLDENWALYNWMDNLFWWTQSDNMKDCFKKWRWYSLFKNNHPKPTLWKFWKDNKSAKPINQYTLEWGFIREWWSIIDAAKELWISKSNISACCRWKQKTAGGFIWKYNNK